MNYIIFQKKIELSPNWQYLKKKYDLTENSAIVVIIRKDEVMRMSIPNDECSYENGGQSSRSLNDRNTCGSEVSIGMPTNAKLGTDSGPDT